MQAKHKRSIHSGREFNRYFDLSRLQRSDPVLLNRGDVFDTILEMARIVKNTLPDTKGIAPVLKGSTLEQTCHNIFDFVYSHIQYTLDKPGVEQLRRPLRSWADRAAGVDCDCYSIFISSILSNLGIEHYFRMTKYQGDWQHIYVVVPMKPGKAPGARHTYYTIDCVVDSFDHEVPFSQKHDKKMSQLQYLNGLGSVTPGFGAEFIGFGNSALSGYLGATDAAVGLYADFLGRLKLHLQNTLTQLKANPKAMPKGVLLRPQLESLLRVWDDAPSRDALLDKLEREEASISTLSGLGELGGLFSSIKKGIQNATSWVGDKVSTAAKSVASTTTKVVKAVGTGVQNAAAWTGDKAGDAWSGVKQAAEWTFDKVVQLNPLTVLMRNGLLLAFKINLFRMAERLGYGYWSESEAVSKGLEVNEYRKLKAKLDDVHKLWRGLQGDEDSLKKNILQGWNHGTQKHGGVRSLGEAATAATTTAATPLIVKIVDWLKSVDWGRLFSMVKGAKPDTDFAAANNVPAGFVLPASEQEYLANQQQYAQYTTSPTAPKPESGGDSTALILGGLLVAGLLLASSGGSKK
ncbi:hypothetical protein [Pontibacter pamirensis]|uniref:hypothetical protein n=1 Tax=Pontibacter pamirensis TaxID=2562824 RepID=UPI001389BECA|nr:hypothetical protein [Pontibacter pamirensis]